MAKVRCTDASRINKKKTSEETPPSKTKSSSKLKTTSPTAKGKTKSNKIALKKNSENQQNDNGVVSSERSSKRRPMQRQSDENASKTLKISNKSKTAISKPRKGTVISRVKKITDVDWMRGLIQEEKKFQPRKRLHGIHVRYPGRLFLRQNKGMDCLMNYFDNKCSGYIRVLPGARKKISTSVSTIHYLVLIGKIDLEAASQSTEFRNGALITIPKGVRYGLTNRSKDKTFIRFHTLD